MKDIILTGVKPTGIPHIGNYLSAIAPAIEMTKDTQNQSYLFIADYHALNSLQDASSIKKLTYEVASTWLACGLNPDNVIFYRQSDIPEIMELFTILTNVTPKGLMNRAHAYKAMVDENKKNGLDMDHNVNMGLYNYPILMAADILLFNTTKVPVGLDQKQHVEIARDIAQYFNNKYGKTLVVPTEIIHKEVATVIGLDGRKMSKSYNNTIQIFSDENTLRKTINKIVTDSTGINEPKSKDNNVYHLYKLFANEQELIEFEKDLQNGISWGEAKKKLFEIINREVAPLREKYNYYISHPEIIEELLQNGANKARVVAQETIKRVKKAIGVI